MLLLLINLATPDGHLLGRKHALHRQATKALIKMQLFIYYTGKLKTTQKIKNNFIESHA
jgi:hypothetical protein